MAGRKPAQAAAKPAAQSGLLWCGLAEVLVGPFKRGQEALAKRFERALGSFELLPVTQEIAVTAARLRASLGLRLPDAIQAATGLESGAIALVTHDRDFSKLKGLLVITGAYPPER